MKYYYYTFWSRLFWSLQRPHIEARVTEDNITDIIAEHARVGNPLISYYEISEEEYKKIKAALC